MAALLTACHSRLGRWLSRPILRLLTLVILSSFGVIILLGFYDIDLDSLPFNLNFSDVLAGGTSPSSLLFHHQREQPRVTISQGTYLGVVQRSPSYPRRTAIDAFLGIPFGASTAGANRFFTPQALGPSDAVFNATNYGPACPLSNESEESEDCLNLNLYRLTQADADAYTNSKSLLPVVVFIHGGAFNAGNGRNRDMASMVAWSPSPIIAVSINYRVGAFGFLNFDVKEEYGKDNGKGPLNIGIQDQKLALTWVMLNIAAFGGDPDKITLMGSSAGAHSIGHHLMHTASPPMFSKVIMESGASTARAVYPVDHPLHKQQLNEFLALVEAKDLPENEIMDFLRKLPMETIKSASYSMYHKYDASLRWPWQPVIDGRGGVIPMAPIEAWKTGNWHKKPILTGFNTNEGAMFVPKKTNTSAGFTEFFHTLLPQLSEDDLKALDVLYPDPGTNPSSPYIEERSGVGAQFKRIEAAYAHFAYIAPVRNTVAFASAPDTSEAHTTRPPVYLYHFAVNRSVIGGANHGDQNDYVPYTQSPVTFSQTQRDIAGEMHAYWTSFIATGDPNVIKEGKYRQRPTWPAYGAGGEKQKMVFGAGSDERAGGKNAGIVSVVHPDGDGVVECDFWWERTNLFESLPRSRR